MRVWKFLGMIVFPIALQTSVFPRFNFLGVNPDLILIITVCYGLHQGAYKGLFFGIISGLFLDLASGGILGISIITLGLLGYGAGYLARLVFKGNFLVPIISVLTGTIISEIISYIILRSFSWRIEFFSFLFHTILPLCLYHLILTGPVYFIVSKALSYNWRRLKVGG